jgi:DNA-binding MarR family transcriptional regulator
MSLIDDMGALYIVSRMERLSEGLKKAAQSIYKEQFKTIKYKWYPVLYAIHIKAEINVVELANELAYAHPTIIDILKEMEEQKLTRSAVNKEDGRRRALSLTPKGKKTVESILPLTRAFEKAVTELIDNKHHLLKAIEAVEIKLKEKDFISRVKKHL